MKQKTNDDMHKVASIMALCANYGSVMEDNLLDIWLDLLSEYSALQVKKGVAEVIKTYKYKTRPPYAVLRDAIDRVSGIERIDPETSLKMQAEAEWDDLLENISRYGRYKEPELDRTTAYVLRGMGGWDAACDWESSRLDWKHKEFVDKWKMAYGHVEFMELGASGIQALTNEPQAASEILGAGIIRKGIEK